MQLSIRNFMKEAFMALTDENMVMPVTPMYGNNGGFGNGFGGDWAWIILLLLLCGNGWNNGGFGGDGIYPWMNQSNQINGGFRDQMISGSINGIQNSLNGISTQLCNGFAGVEQGANARQMADMNQIFGLQTAMSQGFNSLGSQFADCCCENRLANCQTQNVIQSEGSQTRFADANNTRDIIDSQTRGTQAILDKLCQLELDGVKAQVEAKNDRISELQTQLNMANLAASQTAQNALIQQGFSNEVDALYNRLNSCPVPTTPVYGRTPIFTCNNNGCGCGCGNF